jgi:cysteine-rich repeat protein
MSHTHRRARPLLLTSVLAVTVLAPATASAATWGSFSAARIAYATGSLDGGVHSMLRMYILAHGDAIAAPTDELTPEYLSVVDVFYTAMLSDGTGPTAGAPGTLSLDEQAALMDFIAGGGTLIITPDSNGFDGPFPIVYDSWTADYGVTDYAFVFGPGTGQPIIDHPITEGFNGYSLDGTTTFTYPASGQILGTAVSNDNPFLVVFEPASGFDVGGRMLVVADHNALTDGLLDDLGNQQLAQNIVEWAAGECGNSILEGSEDCDDGNGEDGDGCDASCGIEGAGTGETGDTGGSSGGLDDTAGASEDTGTPPASTGMDEGTGTTGPGQTDDTGDEALLGDEAVSSCGCRSDARPSLLTGLLLAMGLLGRRRASRRIPRLSSFETTSSRPR